MEQKDQRITYTRWRTSAVFGRYLCNYTCSCLR